MVARFSDRERIDVPGRFPEAPLLADLGLDLIDREIGVGQSGSGDEQMVERQRIGEPAKVSK